MNNYQPHEAAHQRSAKAAPRPKAATNPTRKSDPVAYAAALEVLG